MARMGLRSGSSRGTRATRVGDGLTGGGELFGPPCPTSGKSGDQTSGRVPTRSGDSSLTLRWSLFGALTVGIAVGAPTARADDAPPSEPDDAVAVDDDPENIFATLDLEDLLQVEIGVTSVTGVRLAWLQTPAAIEVLRGDDIRRAGHRSLAEALRLVPGLHVARIDSGTWAITSRGFNSEFANKLQVIGDGRRLYDPLFSGVYWDVEDMVLEDIDRIEVIRGPGATLWGANAVNGVVNIISKPASETQGLLVSGGGGSFERLFGTVRYGGRIDDETHYRVYGRYRDFDSLPTVAPLSQVDDWDTWQAGFRVDHGAPGELGGDAELTVQGDFFQMGPRGSWLPVAVPGEHQEFVPTRVSDRSEGGNLLARVRRDPTDGFGWTVQAYYDRLQRDSSTGFKYTRDSFDLDARLQASLGDRHQLVAGINYRRDWLRATNIDAIALTPGSRDVDLISGFVQDTVTLVPDRLFAMVGTKLEYNDFSGFEVQPSGRIWWTPDDRSTLWAGVSRPVRTPSWVEQDISLLLGYADTGLLAGGPPSGFTVPLVLQGNPDLDAERLLTWEAGYRRQIGDAFTLDVAGYYSRYSNLIDVIGVDFANVGRADAYGGEIAGRWQVADNWSLHGSYSLFLIDPDDSPSADEWEGSSPRHQFQFHSRLDITKDLELNTALYFVDRLRAQTTDEYFRLDVGVTWRPTHNVEVSAWGQNLLEPRHQEFESPVLRASPSLIERSFAVQATVRF